MSVGSVDLSHEIKRAPLDQQAANVLRNRILAGDLPPGSRLIEATLAKQMGLSRGTVRAALSDLAHETLVEQIAYTRWQVPALSDVDAWELYTLRSVLEGLGARLVADNLTPEMGAKIRSAFAAVKAAAEANKRSALTQRDFELHKLIIDLSGHRRLQRQYIVIEQQVRRYIASSNALTSEPSEIVAQHSRLVKAILDGRATVAEREAQIHNREEGELLVRALRSTAGMSGLGVVAAGGGRKRG